MAQQPLLKRARGADGPKAEIAEVAAGAFSAIVASAAPQSGSRWPQLLAAAVVVRDGEYFYCRGNTSCKGYTQRMKNDSKGGSTNAFQHVLGCCPELLPAPLLLEALLLARGKVEATLSKWCIRAPAPSTGEGANVLAHVRAEVRALSAPSNLMRPDMPFRTKLNMLADAVAEGTAASGMPLNAVSSELVGSIVRIFGPKCPIPGPHMIAARVRPLYAETTKDLSVKLCRIIDDSSVPRDFSMSVQTDMWTADKAVATENGFATTSSNVVDASGSVRTFALGVQHVVGKHDHRVIRQALEDIMNQPFLNKSGASFHQQQYGILTSDTGAAGKKAFLEYETAQRDILVGSKLPPHGGNLMIKAVTDARRANVNFWQPCVDHVAELAVKDVLDEKKNMSFAAIAPVAEGITRCMAFGDYFRDRGRIRALRIEVEKIARTQAEAGVPLSDRVVYIGKSGACSFFSHFSHTHPPHPFYSDPKAGSHAMALKV